MYRLALGLLLCAVGESIAQPSKSYRLPSVDLKPAIIWGSEASGGGFTLAFGGQDQRGPEGRAPTRLRQGDGEWLNLRETLQKENRYREHISMLRAAVILSKRVIAESRSAWLDGSELPPMRLLGSKMTLQQLAFKEIDERASRAERRFQTALAEWLKIQTIDPTSIARMAELNREFDIALQTVDAEPTGRALSALVYEPKTGVFVLFGGDHGDYLLNDVWTFDPKQPRWEPRWPKSAPPPRANHRLRANGDGTITLSGGYTYTSNIEYTGGQYRDLNDGEWIYDLASNTWKGPRDGVPSDQRTYRTGPFDPEWFLQGPKPDPMVFSEFIKTLPINTWVKTNPPKLPQMNRDWGTAVLAPPALILRYSGGHSAHCGTDVLHYHILTNRWELTNPVEFPLGQTYTNTDYPDGFNFNQRPWITGHTYQNYGFDPTSRLMHFLGRDEHGYTYDPARGDWTGQRYPKPRDLSYNSCFYTLTITPLDDTLVCWTAHGKLYRLSQGEWKPITLTGEKLPGAVVDNSTILHDRKRDRLLCFVKPYGDKVRYTGQVHSIDLKTKTVKTLSPAGMKEAADIPYLCQIRYDEANELALVGARLPDGRTPAYDCARDRWVSLKLSGDDPNGPKGRNVSLGLMYDRYRARFWAIDTRSEVYVLNLAPNQADLRPLGE